MVIDDTLPITIRSAIASGIVTTAILWVGTKWNEFWLWIIYIIVLAQIFTILYFGYIVIKGTI
ncbi:hypothetical protein [Candidatus Endomicrobiellum devescovinae]|uniref:hypothetical protein n=1 Tax=Candidatus Endomicrobiellum devescovinae TaxID=3242322 RepID=UPI0028239A33|nr:hypothetical protein [Endomicrobium sp.]